MILDILGGPKVITKILIRAGGRRIRVRERERLEDTMWLALKMDDAVVSLLGGRKGNETNSPLEPLERMSFANTLIVRLLTSRTVK